MKILLVRLSSFGDMIQIFPAITDIKTAYPNARVDWLADTQFKDIPTWHPLIDNTYDVPIRALKNKQSITKNIKKIIHTIKEIKQEAYTHIIDLQSMFKSCILIPFMKGTSYGFDKKSAIEPYSTLFLNHPIFTNSPPKNMNLTHRAKCLIQNVLNIKKNTQIDYGLQHYKTNKQKQNTVIIHTGTTWATKHWPLSYWIELATLLTRANYTVKLSWHGEKEKNDCEQIIEACPNATLLKEEQSKKNNTHIIKQKNNQHMSRNISRKYRYWDSSFIKCLRSKYGYFIRPITIHIRSSTRKKHTTYTK